MSKKSAAVAPPGWEVEPPPAMAEGYTWCPTCQAAFEGDVCPGCAPGRAEVEVEFEGGPESEPSNEGMVTCPICSDQYFGNECPKCSGNAAPAPGPAEPALKNLNDLQEAVKVAELDVKTRNTTESLKCVLTDDEIRRYGIAQARANAEIATAEEELQSVKSQYKSRVDAATANRNDMAKRINNGYEFRQVDCQERWDYTSNVIRVVRMDTYQTVSRRTMTRDEMQRKLF